MVCEWCRARIAPEQVGAPCPRGDALREFNRARPENNAALVEALARSMSRHRPDNRHKPIAAPCPCGREAAEHRVAHTPKGDPCSLCELPASSHLKVRSAFDRKKVVAALRARDGWACLICREDFEDPPLAFPHPRSVSIDHIEPVWRGGTEALENLRLTHRLCNMKRGGVETSPAQHVRDERAKKRHEGK